MNSLSLFAQMYTQTELLDAAAIAAILSTILVFSLFFAAIAYVIGALLLSQIFHKAGLARWAAWVPFYNNWKLFEIGGQHGALSLFFLIPFVNVVGLVFMYIAMYHVGLKLGKSGAFVLLAIFFPYVWYIWLAVDKSVWNETAPGAAPSLTTEPKSAAATTV